MQAEVDRIFEEIRERIRKKKEEYLKEFEEMLNEAIERASRKDLSAA